MGRQGGPKMYRKMFDRALVVVLVFSVVALITPFVRAVTPSGKATTTWATIKAGHHSRAVQSGTSGALVLLVGRTTDGEILVSSPDGVVYDLGILQKAHDGEVRVDKITALPSLTENARSFRAAPPRNSIIRQYITDVTPVHDGVLVTLGPDALLPGCNLGWAKVFADWTISEYERQSGKKWPYHMRSRNSVAVEIMFHCWNCANPLWWERSFPINIGFNERFWNWLAD
jgi:hypothetical protein